MPRLSLSFFGAFQAELNGEPILHFRSANVQGLLVYLAMQAERPFPRESLATLFWPRDTDATAKKNLRQSLYQLRKVLGDSKELAQPTLLVTRQTVQFNPDADFSLDTHQFLTAFTHEKWQTAVSLYAGPLLPGFFCDSEPFEEWLRVERERFYRLILDALEGAANSALSQADYRQVELLAQRQLAVEPWREVAHRQLMQALALAGDRSGALAQYDRCYEALERELGIEPSEQTLALYEQIATNVVAPETTDPTSDTHQLPQPLTSFVGRLAEISHLVQTLNKPTCRLLTLTGAGGVGKTRLAIEAARQFEAQTGNRAYFVSLLGTETGQQAVNAIAKAVGLTPLNYDQAATHVVEKLGEASVLLVLDNAESLLTADGDRFVARLNELSHTLPNGRFLITSRQPLQAQQEWVLPLAGLTLPRPDQHPTPDQGQNYDGLRLFTERAQHANVAFRLTQRNIEDVVAICQQLDGIPLALELAAAQTAQRSTAAILEELAESEDLVVADWRDLPPRHRSLRAVFEQSWALLSDAEQIALQQTAVFRNGFSRAAARAVLGDESQHVETLVAKSLLQRRHLPQGATRVRYYLPTQLRRFLRSDDTVQLSSYDRHARYYLAWAIDHQAYLASEGNNIRAAWGWAQARPSSIKVPRGWRSEWLTEISLANKVTAIHNHADSGHDYESRLQGNILVGRDAELATVRKMLAVVYQQRQNGGLTTILGEAGIGKSHLVAQLQLDHTDLLWFTAPCDETSAQSLRPFRLWLRDYFNLQASQSLANQHAAFKTRFDDLLAATANVELAQELQRLESLLAALVDLTQPDSLYSRLKPEQRRENFQQAIKTLIRAESLLQPLVLHIEDGHWIDTDSRELLQGLLQYVDTFPFAVLVTARPSGFEPLLLLEGRQQTIRLDVLGKTAVSELAAHHLNHTPDNDLLNLLLERGQGNPFHTEQLLIYLRDNGLVAKGRLVRSSGQPLADTLLPIELNNLLVARLGQLEPVARDVVAQASVLGHEFSLRTMQEIVGEDVLRESLERGVETAVWHPVSPDRYSFNHALLRDAAYTTQFDSRRRELHQQAAQAVVATATTAQPQFATIARHFDEAQESKKAVAYYLKAGDKAMENYFIREAHNHYSRGLALAETDRQKLPLYLGREAANHWLGNREQQKEDLRQLVGLTADEQARKLRAEIGLRQAKYALATADYAQAVQHAQRVTSLAMRLRERDLEVQAMHHWGRAIWQQGKPKTAAPILKRALRLAERADNLTEQGHILYDLSIIAYYQNEYDSAHEQLQRAIDIFGRLDDKRNRIRSLSLLGLIAQVNGDYEEALEHHQQTANLAQAIGWAFGEALALGHVGNCYFELGAFEQSRQFHTQAVEISHLTNNREAEVLSRDTMGLCYQFEGKMAEAKEQFELARTIADETNHQGHKAYVTTHLGLLLANLEEIEEARLLLYDALAYRDDIHDEQSAIDTRAALAWLDMAEGDADFALERVQEIVAWLDEHGWAGVELPLQVYWQCYTILKLNGETAANDLLRTAYELLQARAQRIKNESLRTRYLNDVPHHRQLMRAWQAVQQ
ncbi:MAG: tetratricopeptide repeat protein [Chloroflexota bacterium]